MTRETIENENLETVQESDEELMDQKNGKTNRENRKSAASNQNRKRTYPRPKPDRQFSNIDEYLEERDRKYGKTMKDGEKFTPVGDRTETNLNARENSGENRNENRSGRRFGRRSGSRTEERNKRRTEERNERRTEERNERPFGGQAGRKNRQDWNSLPQQEEIAEELPEDENRVEGRNSVTEAFRSGRTVDRLYVQEGLNDGPIATIRRMAKKQGTNVSYVPKERLNAMSETGHHQGVIAVVASYNYSTIDDILAKAKEKGEDPFLILLDGIEDPHNLGAIIRTANLAGAHGVVIGKHRAAGLTAAVVRASAGALNYTPVAKVTNLASTIDDLKKDGMWFVCADMNGTNMYDLEMKGSVGLVIGNEGSGVSRLIREKCDFAAKIPMRGDIDSLNASVATGVLAFEIARQRGI